ncbi:WD40 repeat domain-containing protein [Dictyobacter kobayashii]|uniref:Uncharacterized protein n=1 Tax=Dictyobacter kobayashii TaxID=2014872 RepID=A0A402ARG7_9CHLR|nr:hypothetical protein [Dictyobacter kobayashii]GCE21694.1 hypothetical protein KDK_54940 [Dictyobacter kobayashii]
MSTAEPEQPTSDRLPYGVKLLRIFKEPTVAFIVSMVWSPDGTRVATGSSDKTMRVWEVSSGELLHTSEVYASTVREVEWSPDGRRGFRV